MKRDVEKKLRIADEIFREIEHLMAGGFYRGVIERAYSAMLHAATAALTAREVKETTRQAIVPAFAEAFVKTGLLDKKFHQYFRQASGSSTKPDAVSFASVDHRQAQTMLVRTKEFIAACRGLCGQ